MVPFRSLISESLTGIVGRDMMSLQIVQRTSTGGASVHINVKRFMVQAALIDRFIVFQSQCNLIIHKMLILKRSFSFSLPFYPFQRNHGLD